LFVVELQVTWDEPELLQNVKRVCPWLVEQVSSMPNLHLPNFSPPPRKKQRLPEFPFEGQPLFDPPFPPARPLPSLAPHPRPHHDHGGFIPFFPFPDGSAAAGIQGARHAQLAPFFSDLHIGNLQQSLLFCGVRPADHHAPAAPRISTDLAIGNLPPRRDAPRSPPAAANKADDVKPVGIMLFGRAILTEEQMKSSSPTSPGATRKRSPNTPDRSGSGSGVTEGSPAKNNLLDAGLEPGHGHGQCKAFVESDAVGRNLDLSALGSFEELRARLSRMFLIDDAELRMSHVLYRTAAGEVKHVGDEPFK